MRRLLFAALLFVLSATSAFADCKSDLAAVDAAFKAAGPYHMEMMLKQGNKTTRMSGDVVPPSSFHTISPNGEMMKIGNGTWTKTKGAWMPLPTEMAKMVQSATDVGVPRGFQDATNLACLGSRMIDGKNLTGYEFDGEATFDGVKCGVHMKLYSDPQTNRPTYFVIGGKAMGQSTLTQTITYDPKITIKAPM